MSAAPNADQLADEFATGERDVSVGGGSGKQRTKVEQREHKFEKDEGDTRKIVKNAQNGEEKRREEERVKNEKK